MSRLNGSWLSIWNNSTPTLPEENENDATEPAVNAPDGHENPEAKTLGEVSEASAAEIKPTDIESNATEVENATPELRVVEAKDTKAKKSPTIRHKTLKSKASTNSLASMSAGNWLSWTPKARTALEDDANDEENVVNEDSPEEDEEIEDEENEDEVDDHVPHGIRKKLWSFWNANEGDKPKEAEKPPSFTNTILKTTPSVPSKEDIKDLKDAEEPSEDAVLYKPHDGAQQFNKINTHKNENLRENVIVPDWDSCLPSYHPAVSSASGLPPPSASFDLKNWRNYFSHLSSRFGFGSESNAENHDMEKEFNSLYERSYRLYGRSLAKVPPNKRACLPDDAKRPKNQLEEDAEDANSVSITNDAMGNLLINQRGRGKPAPEAKGAKIRKILIIGVHGFFPTRMIRPLIGAPKGTSLKFANEAERAILRYCRENDLLDEREAHNISIQKIALEKEGKIFDRVEFFTEILTKWRNELNEADFIFVASHSQGTVVSIILLAKLIQSGILNPRNKRIGLLGMAGVNNGPFYGVDKSFFMKAYSAIEHDSLNELFELAKFDSPQSVAYKEAMETIVGANVKICFIGSINDQLVPLFLALASHVFHPNIYRACYIDHSSRTPDFIQKLVSLCCQLQNLGYFDNNVIKELSTVLAGPLTGGGHLKIYNDGKVYDLGLKFALDTDDVVSTPIYVKEYNIAKIGTNPFILPWCLRGLIFNIEKNWPTGKETGAEEVDSLYDLFDRWRPDTKVLKELKFRLNGIRASKL